MKLETLGDLRVLVKTFEDLPDNLKLDFQDSDYNTYDVEVFPGLVDVFSDEDEQEYEFGELVPAEPIAKKICFMID